MFLLTSNYLSFSVMSLDVGSNLSPINRLRRNMVHSEKRQNNYCRDNLTIQIHFEGHTASKKALHKALMFHPGALEATLKH
jgi:hypothetical protein